MQDEQTIEELKKLYSFKPSDIGDALALIVSDVEGKGYIFTNVKTYSHTIIGKQEIVPYRTTNLAIVEYGYEDLEYCVDKDKDHLWKRKKTAIIFQNNYGVSSTELENQEIYYRIMFNNSIFPYLQDYIESLVQIKKQGGIINRDTANAVAIQFIATRNRRIQEEQEKTQNGVQKKLK